MYPEKIYATEKIGSNGISCLDYRNYDEDVEYIRADIVSNLVENRVSQAASQAVPEPNASCEKCRHIFQEDDNDRKDGCGVCLFLSGEEYIKENKIKTDTKPSRNMGAQGIGEDGFAYGYFYINDITDFSCRHFEQK